MRYAKVLEKARQALLGVRLRRDDRFSKLDFGILQVAMMVAALDGDVTADEIKTVGELAKKCRGYSAVAARESFTAALRSAGYLALLSKVEPRKRLLAAFLDEALLALPSGFLNGELSDVRRAFVMWTALAMGDGDYSEVEREAIRELKQTWADMKSALAGAATNQWLPMSPAFRTAVGGGNGSVSPLSDDFLDRVEKALARGDESKVADLVRNG